MSLPNADDRRIHLRNLVMMAFADGSLGQREVNLVADRCAELGLDQVDLEQAIEYGLSENATLDLPEDPVAQRALLGDLIRMMAADGVLEEGEKQLFAFVAAKMGMTPDQLNELIDQVLSSQS